MRVLILVGLSGLIALQFLCQIMYVTSGWYSQWPLSWDQNRYSDYTYFYRLAFLENGFHGLLEAYLQRPPYSCTLLLFSLPVLFFGGSFLDLVLLLSLPIIILDFAVFYIVRIVSRNFSFALLSLLALHFTTSGIVSGSNLSGTAEALRYQLNFLTAILPITLLAIVIAGIRTRSPKVWSLMLGGAIWSALVLRPPALPYFIIIIYPSLAYLWFLQWRNNRNAFRYGACTTVIATAGALAHYYYIKDSALRYFAHTQSAYQLHPAPGIKGLVYYIERGISSANFFLIFLFVVILSFLLLFVRSYLVVKKHKLRNCKKLLLINAPAVFCAYVYLLSYAVPSSNPIKDRSLGDCFILLTVALFHPALLNLLKMSGVLSFLKKRTTRYGTLSATFVLPISFFFATWSVLHDWSRAHHDVTLLRGSDPHRLEKVSIRQVYLKSNEYLKKWIQKEKRKHVSVLFLAQQQLRYESHSFQTLPFFMGIERADVRVRQSIIRVDEILQPITIQQPAAELIFVPHAHPSIHTKMVYKSYAFNHLTDAHHNALVVGLPKVGYRKVDVITISKDFELLVYRFYKPLHYQVKYGFP